MNINYFNSIATVALLPGLLWLSPALAMPPPGMIIKKMDADGDGRISQEEWSKPPRVFKRIDGNKDGYVTAEEISDFRSGAGAAPGQATQKKKPANIQYQFNKDDSGWIDVHFHLVGNRGELDSFDQAAQEALEEMDRSGIGKALVLPPPRPNRNFDIESMAHLAKRYAPRIYVIGGGGTLNPMIQKAGHTTELSEQTIAEFKSTAEKIATSGARAFGEIAAHHVSLSPSHGYESVPADHPLFLLLSDIAAKHDMPIDLHFDPVPEDTKTPARLNSPKNPPVLKENIAAFERLLAHNRQTRIVWAHAGSDPVGWYRPELVERLLARHANLYCSIRAVNHPDTEPVWNPKTGINYAWIKLFKKYPDRFVLGTDSFAVADSYSGQAQAPLIFEGKTRMQRDGINELLRSLDDELERKIARENAIRLYRLHD